LAALVAVAAFAGNSLEQVWELRLSDILTEPATWSPAKGHSIVDLAFSPDGKKLAATIYAGEMRTHLMILDVQSPKAGFRQFDLETCGRFLTWAPDGGALLVCGRVLRLDDGSSCELLKGDYSTIERKIVNFVNSNYWLTADRVIRADRTVTDLGCQPIETWRMTGNWYVAGTVPTRGWMLLGQSTERTVNGKTLRFPEYAIADRDSHTFTAGPLLRAAYQDRNTLMAEGARAFCSQLTPGGGYKPMLRCWKLPGGELFPLASELKNYGITQAAYSSPRVIAEEWGYHAFDFEKEVPDILRVIVVDLFPARRVASLKPRTQREYFSLQGDRYYRYALSPKGELLAEGGDGVLSLFRLP
jgi:hypothetical protein